MQRASLRSVLSTARRSTTALPLRRPRNATALRLAPLSTRSNLPISNAGSMNTKKLSLALLSGLVLTGAWYYKVTLSGASETGFPIADEPSSTSSTTTTAAAGPGATEGPRKAVAVDNESVYTGTPSAGPGGRVSKEVENNNGEKVVEMLTPEQATSKLRRNEESYFVGRGKGVWRYDVVQIPSNDPIEDDHAEKIIEVPPTIAPAGEGQETGPSDWMFWGVFDGHSGWTTSAKLRQVLITFVAREISNAYKAAVADPASKTPSPESIDNAIKKGFLQLDHEIIHESVDKVFKNPSKLIAAETLAPALSGSCALLAFYESRSKLLRVAVTGDSRAVLGRRGSNGKWTATPLSEDQTGANESEAERMRNEHPGEEYVVRNGRVLGGLEPTRAFGDAFYKWSYDTQMKIKGQFFGRTPTTLLKTPPYVTAEPVITTTRVEPEKGDFLVMATDGLWEMLTNEEVVGLVGKWLDDQKAASKDGKPWFGSWFGGGKDQGMLPVETVTDDATGQRQPIRVRQWGVTAKDSERFVCEDRNAATHLVRNALGGKNQDMLCALLTLPSPYSRRYRDDLTVEVIFFGDNTENNGQVTINKEATATVKSETPQAKL